MSDRDKFQGVCLQSDAGYKYMSVYDNFPPEIRKRLQDSPFNLCAACIDQDGITMSRLKRELDPRFYRLPSIDRKLIVIDAMEEAAARMS